MTGVIVTGPTVTTDPGDTYPTHKAILGLGGFRAVADATARLALPADRREIGMWVHQIDTDEVWQLQGGILDANWVLVGHIGSYTLRFTGNGQFTVDTSVDGAWIAPDACTIISVVADVGERGNTGGGVTSTIWDVHKNGTTIFTTQSNRPTIATSGGGGAAHASSGTIEVPTVAAGDRITVDTDAVANGSIVPANFTIIIKVVQ